MKTEITEKLDRLGVDYKLRPHGSPVYTSEDAARERGVRLSQIVKTMLLSDGGNQVIVTVLPGSRRLDSKAVKKLTGIKNLRFMDRESLQKRFNMTVGAIAPIADGFAGYPTFLDPAVLEETWVDISSGNPDAGIELNSKDLERLLDHARVARISKPA